MRSRIVALGAVVALAATPLSACASDDSPDASPTASSTSASATPTATPTAAAATGVLIKGKGYSFHAPQGWRNVTKRLKEIAPGDRVASADHPFQGYVGRVYVRTSAGGDGTDSTLNATARQIRSGIRGSAPDFKILPRLRVDGAPTAHLAGLRHEGKVASWLEMFVIVTDDASYTVSFSFSPRLPKKDRDQLMSATLTSWKLDK